jgi:hypothetical protein
VYHPAITARLIDAERRRTANAPEPTDRFLGVYHSADEILAFETHMDGLLTLDQKPDVTRPLTPHERQWVVNERTLATLDARYWYTRYARIVNDQNVNVPFVPNVAQRMVIDFWGELEAKGWAIMMVQLKARQLGVSTLTELEVLRRGLFTPDVNGVVASCDDDKSKLMFLMIERAWEQQPWWLVPGAVQHKTGKYLKLQNNSTISVESGSQMSGIGRGYTPQIVHISELADFFDAGALIDDSLLHAVHPHPSTFFVLESTAKGFDNWWHDTWEQSEREWNKGVPGLCPIFLPWFCGRDIYPTKTWLRQRPIPPDWVPSEKTETHAVKAALYVRTSDRLKAVYAADWTMPVAQQWYYEKKYEAAVEKNRLPQFLSEMPSDPNEAFQSTNIAAVDVEDCLWYRDRALARPPLAVLGIRGPLEEIPVRFQPTARELDPRSAFKPVTLTTYLGAVESVYHLVPLIFNSYSESPFGRLYLWELPEDGWEYGLGIDMGDGVGQDRSVIEVFRRISLHEPWVQCAEFATPYMNSLDFWPIVQAVAIYFSVRRYGSIKQPKIVVECRGNGETVQLELKKCGWSNFHYWVKYDTRKIDQSKAHHLGVLTNGPFRRMMMDKILHVFNNRDVDLRSPWMCDEFRRLERDELRQQFRADSGGHDDRIMAMGFVLWSLDALQLSVRSKRRSQVTSDDGDPVYTDPHGGEAIESAGAARANRLVTPPDRTRPRI